MVVVKETVHHLTDWLTHAILRAERDELRSRLATTELCRDARYLEDVALEPLFHQRFIAHDDGRKLAKITRHDYRLCGQASRIVDEWWHEHRGFVHHDDVEAPTQASAQVGAVDGGGEDAATRHHFVHERCELLVEHCEPLFYLLEPGADRLESVATFGDRWIEAHRLG